MEDAKQMIEDYEPNFLRDSFGSKFKMGEPLEADFEKFDSNYVPRFL